jgi:hypothetical protein
MYPCIADNYYSYVFKYRFLPLWVGARGIEFDWKYIQMSLDSNIALVRSCISFDYHQAVHLLSI